MIPDFPEAKKALGRALDEVVRQKARQSAPLYALVNKKRLHEGDSLGILDAEGRHRVNPLIHAQSEFTISSSEVPTLKTEEFIEKVAATAEDLGGQIERGILKTLDEAITESGNVIQGNPELSPASFLTALETVQIDFEDDDRGKPVHPTIIAAPAAAQKLKELEASLTPEEREANRRREKEIMDRKFQEHLADLASRRIVD